MNNNLSKKLIDDIKNENITPTPKWKFRLRSYLLWGVGGVFVVVGGLSVSVIIYIFRYSEPDVYRQLTDGWTEFLLLFLPVFWLGLLVVAVLAVLYDFKCTKKGYKYPLSLIAATVILASLSLGMIFSYSGIGRAMDDILGRRAPYYSKVINPRVDFWCQPDQGRLVGIITSVTGEKTFVLRGCGGRDWAVQAGKVHINSENRPVHLYIESGASVRAIGRKISESEFMAERVLPMQIGREFLYRHQPFHDMGRGCSDCIHR
jgi:hypothetical protein